ncbi:MAG TPA: acyltransferase family protein, partial [Candidatus Thermoplasmatota archaeon]|nr:acyltransferase family protein [Candidatus Thermoplasmatota archaeon]
WALYPQPQLYYAIATLPAFAAHFAFGLTAARIRRPSHAFRVGAGILAGSLALGVLAWQAGFGTYEQAWGTRLSNMVARPLLALAFAALLVAIRDEAGVLHHVLSARWLHAWGERSYSLYLTHVPVLVIFTQAAELGRVPFWLFALLATPACLAFAALFHRLVEAPMLRLRAQMRERSDQPAP